MREQVIATRGSRRSAVPAKGFVQRPTRRDGRTAGAPSRFSPRAIFGYLPSALKFVLAIIAVVSLIVGYRVAASASLFQVRSVDVSGTSRTSAEEIEGLARRAVARTGIWRADLTAISAELGRLPGVRRAIVTRVLPDRLRVRVTERVPVAVVRTAAGHFVWVDDEGVALGEMKPVDRMPSFFIRGWNEDGTEDARKENAERVQKYLEVAREWEAAGLSERVSEVNLIDVRDVRAQLAGNDSQIEVRLGAQDLNKRLKRAIEVLDEYRNTPRGAFITYIDFQGNHVIVGSSSGDKISATTKVPEPAPSSTATGSTPLSNARAANANTTVRKNSGVTSSNANSNANNANNRNSSQRDKKPGENTRSRLR
ncbi:MAG TPA: FtsQ-type POTRA domain-containing protein [Pyrinomonadaceae bacterium]|nr:FtsQ-type POTRA domain-containing protein [Pyrinomonadaceae bacterium]